MKEAYHEAVLRGLDRNDTQQGCRNRLHGTSGLSQISWLAGGTGTRGGSAAEVQWIARPAAQHTALKQTINMKVNRYVS